MGTSRTPGSFTVDLDGMWQAMDQLRSTFDRRDGSRAPRGEIRTAILALLAERPMHGYQVIHRLQMVRNGREFGNEFRYRDASLEIGSGKPARLEGDYLQVDLVKIAEGLGARAVRATTADEVRAALAETRDHAGPVVLVVPVIPHADLPGAGVWWDVAPAEVCELEAVAHLRDAYEEGLASQRWYG